MTFELLCKPLIAWDAAMSMKGALPLLFGCLLLAEPAADAQFTCATNSGTITIIGYAGPGGAVTIPVTTNGLPVTGIGSNAFYQNTNLTSITIPGGVANIGQGAFEQCTNLTNAILGNGIIDIGSAFYGCSGLTSAIIPASITNLGEYAFERCTGLTNVIIPNGASGIGNYAFAICTNLTTVTVPGNLDHFGPPGHVEAIFGSVFAGCPNLTTAIVADGATSIAANEFTTFSGAPCLLTNIILPASVTSIGVAAFNDCTRLISITIPASVTNIGDAAFDQCTNLTSITVPGDIDFSPVFYGYPKLTTITIADGATSIAQDAFKNLASLTSVTIPGSVTDIGTNAFDGCSGLEAAYFRGNAPSADSTVFGGDGNLTVYYLPGTLGWGPTFGGALTVPWTLPHPVILDGSAGLGVQSNGFGFNVSWATNISVVVEACANLSNPAWQPLQTNALTNGTFYFSDPLWMNYPGRFYRVVSQ